MEADAKCSVDTVLLVTGIHQEQSLTPETSDYNLGDFICAFCRASNIIKFTNKFNSTMNTFLKHHDSITFPFYLSDR